MMADTSNGASGSLDVPTGRIGRFFCRKTGGLHQGYVLDECGQIRILKCPKCGGRLVANSDGQSCSLMVEDTEGDRMKRVFGVTYGLVGDLVMGLPYLKYFDKKYPGCYKTWAVQKKVAFVAPVFLNHPDIDRIHITGEWQSFSKSDVAIMYSCDLAVPLGRKIDQWWNELNCIESKALMADMDLEDVRATLSGDDWIPRLTKWFTPGLDNPKQDTYSKVEVPYKKEMFRNSIGIYPFAVAGKQGGRSPTIEWWRKLVGHLVILGYNVYHFGSPFEERILTHDRYISFSSLDYFRQLKAALATDLVIGTDSGSMWVVGAYEHPAIHLMTNWLPGHEQNFRALEPTNRNGTTILKTGGCNNITVEEVVESVKKRSPL